MPRRLLRFDFSPYHPEPRMFRQHDRLAESYDEIINALTRFVPPNIRCLRGA